MESTFKKGDLSKCKDGVFLKHVVECELQTLKHSEESLQEKGLIKIIPQIFYTRSGFYSVFMGLLLSSVAINKVSRINCGKIYFSCKMNK